MENIDVRSFKPRKTFYYRLSELLSRRAFMFKTAHEIYEN